MAIYVEFAGPTYDTSVPVCRVQRCCPVRTYTGEASHTPVQQHDVRPIPSSFFCFRHFDGRDGSSTTSKCSSFHSSCWYGYPICCWPTVAKRSLLLSSAPESEDRQLLTFFERPSMRISKQKLLSLKQRRWLADELM